MAKRYYIWLFLFLAFFELQAQSRYRVGTLPSINLNKKIDNNWKLNFKVETRQPIQVGHLGQPARAQLQYERTDITSITSRKMGANSKLAAGLMLRQKGDQLLFRTLQQYSIVRPHAGYRLAHRFSTDQTFESQAPVQYRIRYRIGADFALNGQAVDRQEFYVKMTNEYLAIIKEEELDLEIRLVPILGYAYTDNNKIELGLDYRGDSIFSEDLRNNFWITLGWFLAI